MTLHAHYRLNRHRKFEQEGRKYVADLETNDIVEVNDVEWEVLTRYGTQTQYQIVEALKEEYKVESIFDGIERLERLGQQGSLLSPIDGAAKGLLTTGNRRIGNRSCWCRSTLQMRKHLWTIQQSESLSTSDPLDAMRRLGNTYFFQSRRRRLKTAGLSRLWEYPDSGYRDRRKQCLRSSVVCNGWIRWYSTPLSTFDRRPRILSASRCANCSLYRRCSEVTRFDT